MACLRIAIMKNALEAALARSRKRRELPDPQTRRLIRVRAGVTQADLAGAVGVDPASISRWESGGREPADLYVAGYADALGRLMAEVVGPR
jgi:DNA-binding XRE family transcriptional regulator